MSNKAKETTMKPDGKPTLTPKLRFPEFRDAAGWEMKSIGQLGEVVTGSTPSTAFPEYYGGDRLFVSPADIADGRFIEKTKTTLSALGFRQTRPVKANSILFSCIGTIGKIAQNRQECATNQQINSVIPHPNISGGFAYYALCMSVRKIADLAGKQTIPIVNKSLFSSVELAFPKLPEQQKLAEFLSSVDELIYAQAQKLGELKTHKKGLMQRFFPRDGETRPRLRFPEFQNVGKWKEQKLGTACRMQAGKFVSASEIREQNAEGLFPCYGGNGLRGYTTTFTHSGKYPLIGRQGALCGNMKFGIGQFHATEHAVVVTPEKGIVVDWLFYLLDFLNLNQYATGQAQPGLSVDVLDKVLVVIPNQEAEQQRIADCLTSLDDLITAQTKNLDALKTHKKGLMQNLFPSSEEVEA